MSFLLNGQKMRQRLELILEQTSDQKEPTQDESAREANTAHPSPST